MAKSRKLPAHVAWRKAGFTKDNTSERGMWFVDQLDTLGKTMGLQNGIRDLTRQRVAVL